MVCFSEVMCQFLLTCFKVHIFIKIFNKTGKFLLNYRNLFVGPLFIRSHCIFLSDVPMFTISGTVRRFLEKFGEDIDEIVFVVTGTDRVFLLDCFFIIFCRRFSLFFSQL